jgi:hypothetical protein
MFQTLISGFSFRHVRTSGVSGPESSHSNHMIQLGRIHEVVCVLSTTSKVVMDLTNRYCVINPLSIRSLSASRGSATVKQHISAVTLVVHPLTVMASKDVLVPHRTHSFIVNVQPSFRIIAVSVRVEHIDRIVPAICRLAVVVKNPIQLVMHRFRRFPGNGCHDFWTDQATKDLSLDHGSMGETTEKIVPSGISSSGPN